MAFGPEPWTLPERRTCDIAQVVSRMYGVPFGALKGRAVSRVVSFAGPRSTFRRLIVSDRFAHGLTVISIRSEIYELLMAPIPGEVFQAPEMEDHTVFGVRCAKVAITLRRVRPRLR